jgi:hypothetical protein
MTIEADRDEGWFGYELERVLTTPPDPKPAPWQEIAEAQNRTIASLQECIRILKATIEAQNQTIALLGGGR